MENLQEFMRKKAERADENPIEDALLYFDLKEVAAPLPGIKAY